MVGWLGAVGGHDCLELPLPHCRSQSHAPKEIALCDACQEERVFKTVGI